MSTERHIGRVEKVTIGGSERSRLILRAASWSRILKPEYTNFSELWCGFRLVWCRAPYNGTWLALSGTRTIINSSTNAPHYRVLVGFSSSGILAADGKIANPMNSPASHHFVGVKLQQTGSGNIDETRLTSSVFKAGLIVGAVRSLNGTKTEDDFVSGMDFGATVNSGLVHTLLILRVVRSGGNWTVQVAVPEGNLGFGDQAQSVLTAMLNEGSWSILTDKCTGNGGVDYNAKVSSEAVFAVDESTYPIDTVVVGWPMYNSDMVIDDVIGRKVA